jgi:hypothetical protein
MPRVGLHKYLWRNWQLCTAAGLGNAGSSSAQNDSHSSSFIHQCFDMSLVNWQYHWLIVWFTNLYHIYHVLIDIQIDSCADSFVIWFAIWGLANQLIGNVSVKWLLVHWIHWMIEKIDILALLICVELTCRMLKRLGASRLQRVVQSYHR